MTVERHGTLRSETKTELYVYVNSLNLQQITNKLFVLTDF